MTHYSVEALTARLDEMHEDLEYCASERPEFKGRLDFLVTFAVDKVGVPAFVYLQRNSEESGYAPPEAWRQLRACLQMVITNQTYPKPLADKGVRIFIPLTMNPQALRMLPVPPM